MAQCEAALDTPYIDPEGREINLKEMYLIFSFPLSEQAKQNVRGKLSNLNSVSILDGAHLADLLYTNMPGLLESGSKPIEQYLGQLIDYCDSVEDYVANRLRARYSLHSVYVKPLISVEVIPTDTLRHIPQFTELDRWVGFTKQIRNALPLLQHRMLPAINYCQILRYVNELVELADLIPNQRWYVAEYEAFQHDLRIIMHEFGVDLQDTLTAIDASEMRNLAEKYAAGVNADLLKKIGGVLFTEVKRCLTDRLNDRIFTFQRHSVDIYFSFDGDGSQVPPSRKQKDHDLILHKARTHLADWYHHSIESRSLTGLIAMYLAEFLVDQGIVPASDPVSTQRLDEPLVRIAAFIHQLESALRKRNEAIWPVLEDLRSSTTENRVITSDLVAKASEANQLCRLLQQIYGPESIRSSFLTFDGLTFIARSTKLLVVGELQMRM